MRALPDQRDLAVIAVERTRTPMIVTDPRRPDNPIVLANHAYLALSGFDANDVIGRNGRMLQGPETSAVALSEIRDAVVRARDVTVEILNYKKSGETFWNQLHISPIFDDSGKLIYFLGSQMDVTKRRHAQALERTERRLLREVDHRALNALALVQGIVRLSRSDDPARYASAIQRRVGALARAHALLADGSWADVSLRRLIEGEVEPYAAPRVVLEGDDVAVPAYMVQPLTLTLQEMALNAAVHGALSTPLGSVSIAWRSDGWRDPISIRWCETGGPTPGEPGPSGFGFSMMRSVVERQLRGSLEMDWRREGLVADLAVPKEAYAHADLER